MKRQLRTILFAIAGAVLGILVSKFVLRREGSTVLAAVAGAIVGALAALGGGQDEKAEAEAARRGDGRPGDAPHDSGGTEDEIEAAAARAAAAQESEEGGGD